MEAEELEVDVVPLLFQGKLESMEQAKEYMAGIQLGYQGRHRHQELQLPNGIEWASVSVHRCQVGE